MATKIGNIGVKSVGFKPTILSKLNSFKGRSIMIDGSTNKNSRLTSESDIIKENKSLCERLIKNMPKKRF